MFNLTFLNSILLIGLVAGIIPVLIHLFVKHQPKTIYFSSLRFLKEIQQSRARITNLRQILLLITRVLIIILLIMALARPVIKTELTEATESHAPTAIVLIVDNSFSMNYLDEDNTLLDRAQNQALNIVEKLNGSDRIMVLTLNSLFNNQHRYFLKPSEVTEIINEIRITDNAISISKALDLAEQELNRFDMINKEIYFITDNQKHIWQNIEDKKDEVETDIFVIPVREHADTFSNLSTISAWFVPAILTGEKHPEIRATIKNFSDKPAETVLVSLILNNITRAEKAISLSPYQSKEVAFELPPEAEDKYFGEVKVKDELLPDDNSFYFSFSATSHPKIAMISSEQPAYHLVTALDLITDNDWQWLTPDEVTENIIGSNQLFILYHPNYFSEKMHFFAEQILEQGKALFLIPNDKLTQVSPLMEWLNKRKVSIVELDTTTVRIDFINNLHPICTIFTEDMFRSVTVQKMLKIDAPDFIPLLAGADLPLLLIQDNLLISAIDFRSSWTNLVYQPVFPILMYHICGYLGVQQSTLHNYITGTPFPISSKGELHCHLPTGEVVPVTSIQKDDKFTQTDVQGHYFLFQEDELKEIFSYNTSREESDLTILSPDEKAAITEIISKFHFLSSDDWESHILTSRYGYEMWKILLWIVLGLVIFEMILAYSGRKRGKGTEAK